MTSASEIQNVSARSMDPAWSSYVPGLLLLSCPRPGSLTERADYCIDCWRFADFQTATCLEHTPSISKHLPLFYHQIPSTSTNFVALWQLDFCFVPPGNMDSSLTGRCPRPLCAPGLFHQGPCHPCALGKGEPHRYAIRKSWWFMMYFSSPMVLASLKGLTMVWENQHLHLNCFVVLGNERVGCPDCSKISKVVPK